jgi:hypothetical protein
MLLRLAAIAAAACAASSAASSAAAPPRVLFRANWSAPFRVVTEAALCGSPAGGGQRRSRLPSPTEDWVLESGTPDSGFLTPTATASVDAARGLTLANHGSHLVLWRNQAFPPDSELRFGVQPQNASHGLNIVFFSASAAGGSGGSIFALDQPPRHGNYSRYTKGAIQTYSDSYFRPNGNQGIGICDRTPAGLCAANLRKDPGFHLVAAGVDLIGGQGQRVYEVTVRRKGGMLSVLVDGKAEVEWEDPAPLRGNGYVGLRQMLDTGSSLYTHFEVVGA